MCQCHTFQNGTHGLLSIMAFVPNLEKIPTGGEIQLLKEDWEATIINHKNAEQNISIILPTPLIKHTISFKEITKAQH